jgi:Ca-activated chloride channel family protein
MTMHFAQPSFLFVGFFAVLALVALFGHLAVARRRALVLLGSSHLLSKLTASVSRVRRRIKEAMIVTGVGLVAVALARPQLGVRFEEAHRRGVDVLFAVDTSKSMLTPDVKPNRLERAKLAVRDLVQRFPDDRVGLVAFAGSAFLETPLTLDHAIFEQSLDGLDTSVIPLGGTDVASAIDVAENALAGDEHKKVLVLLTDGEDLSGTALSAAEGAAKQGLVVYTVGVGTPRGELVPLASNGQTSFVKDEEGHFVTSRLDESLLRQIATATGGSYRALGDNGQGLESLYNEELATLPRSDLASRSQRVPIERFQWPLGIGLLLLGFEPFLSERRKARAARAWIAAPRPRRVIAGLAGASVAAIALCAFTPSAFASPQSAERAYRDGQFAKSQADYAGAARSKPGDPKLDFNLGAAAYRNGDLDAATKSFQSALRTDDLALQERGYYNLGDALYRDGERALKGGKKDETIGTWKKAVSGYEAALRLDSKDADAIYNRDFVKGRLAELEKQQQEQQPQDQKKDQQSKSGGENGKDKKPSKSDGQGQGKPDQGKSGQGKPDQGKSDANDKSSGSKGDPSKPGSEQGQGSQGQKPPQSSQPQAGQGQSSGNPGAKPDQAQPTPSQGGAHANAAKPGEDDAPSAAGELSKGEARALLDSLRGELQVKPRAPAPPNATQDQPRKDW